MRSLGRWHFYRHEYDVSIECFNKSFEINRHRADDWFMCGCAHMRKEEFNKAIFAFGNVVSIDEQQVEAWGNIANCYSVQEKYKEALACTEQALKYNRRHWRIWQNAIHFSVATKNFYKAVNSVRELLRNQEYEGLNSKLLLQIVDIYLSKYTVEAGKTREEELRHRKNLYRFFTDYTNCISDFQVWRLYCRIKTELDEPVAELKECKMNEIRALQKINWHVDLDQCKLVERAVIEFVEMSDQRSNEEGGALTSDQKAFIKTTVIAIEEGLQRKCKVEDMVQRMSQ